MTAPQSDDKDGRSPPLSLRHLQKHLPWTLPYSEHFEATAYPLDRVKHDVLHLMKSLGRVAAECENHDHGRDRKLYGPALAKEVADFVICALHIAKLQDFDLQDAVIQNSEARNAATIPPESSCPLPECGTCNDDPAVCATVPGLRHCEKAMREAEPGAQTPLEIVEEWKDWIPYPNSTAAEWDRYTLAAYIARSTSGTNWREWRPEPEDIANMTVDDALIRLGQVAYERDLLLARINAVSATRTPKP